MNQEVQQIVKLLLMTTTVPPVVVIGFFFAEMENQGKKGESDDENDADFEF